MTTGSTPSRISQLIATFIALAVLIAAASFFASPTVRHVEVRSPNDTAETPRQISGEIGQDISPNFEMVNQEPTNISESLWWVWRAPTSGDMRFSTVGSDIDTAIEVRGASPTGPVTGSGRRAGDLSTAEAVIAAVEGETYFIRVYSEEDEPEPGLVVLTWQLISDPVDASPAPSESRSAQPNKAERRAIPQPSTPPVPPAITPQSSIPVPYSAPEIPVLGTTGEKPQSKLWQHDGTWWAVLAAAVPSDAGTWVWRRDGNVWSAVVRVSDRIDVRGDVLHAGDITHILLHGPQTALVSLQYNEANGSYVAWGQRPDPVPISLPGSETATIALDGEGRMWLATETLSQIQVRWADAPYSSFSSPVTIASGIDDDDIAAITTLPGKIGVLWSNQQTRRFGFKTHTDGTPPGTWSAEEQVPASALNIGGGVADDHVNLAVSSDGTLYAAVKTSYDTSNAPVIALLVRHSDGSWDDLHEVDTDGTRPIVQINEQAGSLRVLYTATEGLNNILSKTTSLQNPSFSESADVVLHGQYNNITGTKSFTGATSLIMAAGPSTTGTTSLSWPHLAPEPTPSPTPSPTPEPSPSPQPGAIGIWTLDETTGTTATDHSGQNNNGTITGGTQRVPGKIGNALHLNGTTGKITIPHNNTLNPTTQLTITAWVRPEQTATQYIVKKAEDIITDGYELSLASTGKPFFRLNRATSADTYRVNAPTTIPANGTTWTHLAATYDGNTMRLYVNGQQVSTTPGPTTIGTNDLPLTIGAEPPSFRHFQGTIDEVQLHNQALTTSEIQAIYTNNTPDPTPEPSPEPTPTPTSEPTPTPEPSPEPTPSPTPEPSPSPQPGAIGIWTLDETTGTTATDHSGQNNNGTITGGTQRVPGKIGNALHLNGTTGKITIPHNNTLNPTTQLTITAWVRPEQTATQYIVKKAEDIITDGYELSLASTGKPFFRLNRATSADTYRVNAPTTIPANGTTWTHLAATYDGNTMRLYVNGQQVSTTPGPTTIGTNDLPLTIGAEPPSFRHFQGTIDEVQLHDSALTTSEIQAIYTNTAPE